MNRTLTVAAVLALALALSSRASGAPTDGGSTPVPSANEARIQKRVGAFSTVALGLPGLSFVNELVGARLELVYTPRFALGFSLAYANLKGKDGRVSNVLPEASLAYHVPLGESFGIPIRFAGGFLPKNGPTLRLTSGFDLALGDSVAIELALLEPMVWVARDNPEFSLNFGAAVRATF